MNLLAATASRVFVFTYYWAIACAVAALARLRWNDHCWISATFGFLLALVFAALGVGTVLRPMRAGVLHVTSLFSLGGFALFIGCITFPTALFWPSIGTIVGSVLCLLLLDRVIWETERRRLRAKDNRASN